MGSAFIYGAVAVLAVLIAVFLLPIFFVRGKWLKCPNCAEVFRAPLIDVRTTGFGWSPPYLGRVICPECQQARRRGRYEQVPAPMPPAGPASGS